jgi:uncharacterized protein YxeA
MRLHNKNVEKDLDLLLIRKTQVYPKIHVEHKDGRTKTEDYELIAEDKHGFKTTYTYTNHEELIHDSNIIYELKYKL